MDAHADWFSKIPQKIILKKKNHHKKISSLAKNKKIIHKLRHQALYNAWNSGSSQKSMWLLAIENIIHEWEKKGILKENTSFVVFLSPVWSSYIALLIVLFLSDIFYEELIKNLYSAGIAWILCSIIYFSFIFSFILERKENEMQMDNNIKRLIPYELRSTAPRCNNIYTKFRKKHFLSFINILFSVMLTFYISLIGLLK